MKKLSIALAAIILMLTATSCGNDEPKDIVWMMNTQLINHITNSSSGDLESASLGGVYVELNTTKMTANVAYAVAIGSDEVVFNLSDVPMTLDYSHNGYYVRSSATATAGSHTMAGLDLFVDMNLNEEALGHWAAATIDGKYELNGIVPIVQFKGADSVINLPDGSTLTDKNGTFIIEVLDFTTDSRSASVTIKGVTPIEELNKGLTYEGLKVEATYEGLHITSDKAVYPTGETKHQLNEVDITIDVFAHSLSAVLDIENVARLTTHAAL